MLNAYRGLPNDRPAVAPELWYYYPAKLLGVDMIEFQREVKFHLALKHAFDHFGCEGWGIVFAGGPNPKVTNVNSECWLDADNLQVVNEISTPHGRLRGASILNRHEPSWNVESLVKDPACDLAAWEDVAFGEQIEQIDPAPVERALVEVGDAYLLEGWLGVPFFDFYASSRDGGFQTAVLDFLEPEFEPTLERLRHQYIDLQERRIDTLCSKTSLESYCLGCSWSCNSLIGPDLWRRWDKPVIKAVADALHRRGKLLHIHFHGKCLETVADFAEIGVDCVCPFERPPGGDVAGLEGLKEVERRLGRRTTMNGNVHTVETLIRGTEQDVRREVAEILEAFAGNPRVIVGTGDQVGGETPEENLFAMIDEARTGNKNLSKDRRDNRTR